MNYLFTEYINASPHGSFLLGITQSIYQIDLAHIGE